MNLDDLERHCVGAYLAHQDRITLSLEPGATPRRGAGFPRGELLSIGTNSCKNYSFDTLKVMAWLKTFWVAVV